MFVTVHALVFVYMNANCEMYSSFERMYDIKRVLYEYDIIIIIIFYPESSYIAKFCHSSIAFSDI